jgi:ATP-dependent DNA helicase DinG
MVFGTRRACLLCSATMTVAGRFDYLAGRLGLSRLGAPIPAQAAGDEREPGGEEAPGPRAYDALLLGTPFDFARQARVYVPAWLAEPGYAETGRNSTELAAMLAGLFRASRGRGLALFTSYGALDEVYRELKPVLEAEGIAVLGQGRDGSRESLLAALQGGEPAVLLGTSSFWEGVDVRGPALSCLVLARLPFQVHTEPLFQARAELVESRGHNSFMDYSLPEAVLKFRQGFGRLIRSRSDRGVAVLADKRLVSKRYGTAFLRSLPCRAQVVTSLDQLVSAVEEFFAGER